MSKFWTWDDENDTILPQSLQLMNPKYDLNNCKELTNIMSGIVNKREIRDGWIKYEKGLFGKGIIYYSTGCSDFKNFVETTNKNSNQVYIKHPYTSIGKDVNYVETRFDPNINKVTYSLSYLTISTERD